MEKKQKKTPHQDEIKHFEENINDMILEQIET